jgi:hypothetical protein
MKLKKIYENLTVDLEKGDIVLGGRFKNKPYTFDHFETDENGQPLLVTDKGKKLKFLSVRIKKLME